METRERQQLQELLVRLSQGDRAAFAPAFSILWPMLRALCIRALGDAARGEDAAQSALYKIFARADELDPARDAVAWAAGVALWECKTLRKSPARRREVSASHASESNSPDSSPIESNSRATHSAVARLVDASRNPEEIASASELHRALEEAIGALRPADAEVIEALLRDEPPPIPRATFRKRVQRATARLREAWRHRHGTD